MAYATWFLLHSTRVVIIQKGIHTFPRFIVTPVLNRQHQTKK